MKTLRAVESAARSATSDEQQVLARWSGWGAVSEIFDRQKEQHSSARAELEEMLTLAELRAAERSTLNAHYTDASIVEAIWAGVVSLGFAGGQVLEPGCGAGNFIAFAPSGARMTGVELDPTTAGIARALYPQATIRAESFADTKLPVDFADLVIGNVPFGDVVLHDRVGNANRHSLHNYFIVKSLAATRPGGLVAVLTSHWTMDARNPAARRDMAGYADLVAALRLPSGAHRVAAGTDVLTDLLIFRRHTGDQDVADGTGWETTTKLGGGAGDGEVGLNRYFVDHPQHVLGQIGLRQGQFGPELEVMGTGPVGAELSRALRAVAQEAATAGLSITARPELDVIEAVAAGPDADPGAYVGLIRVHDDGRFSVTTGTGTGTAWHDVPATQRVELAALIGLRDTFIELVAAESATAQDNDVITDLRVQLNDQYDSYAQRFGPINRCTRRATSRTDKETGDPVYSTVRPAQGRFRDDPFSAGVMALEHYDVVTDTATKADIFTERVIAPRPQRLGADIAADAVAICLDVVGRVDMEEIARLLGVSSEDALLQVTGLVYDDPSDPGNLIPAAEYLSGNVRAKLVAASAAADGDAQRWAANRDALQAVQPKDLLAGEIDARMGAAWINAEVIQQFLSETLDDPRLRVENPGGSIWAVKGNRDTVLATSKWGTRRMAAPDIAKHVLEQRAVIIRDTLEDGTSIVNVEETVAAQEKATELNEEFSEWLWADPARSTAMARIYNDQLNNIVLRSYDGTHMQLPGMATSFRPRAHQYAAIARIVSEPSVGLFHEVGAGKTATMVAGAMELRRLGMARKIAVVVPNHMLEQFSREWLQLYPQAKVLAASAEDLSASRRRVLVAKVATGDWDAVIVSQSAFGRIGMRADTQAAYLDREVDQLRQMLTNSNGENRLTVKRIQGTIARAEERIKAKLDSEKDPGILFEELGVDYLMVDITDRATRCSFRSSCVISGTSRGCLPTVAGTSVTFGRRRLGGTTSGDRQAAGAADRAEQRRAVMDDRQPRRQRALRGGQIPAGARRFRDAADVCVSAG